MQSLSNVVLTGLLAAGLLWSGCEGEGEPTRPRVEEQDAGTGSSGLTYRIDVQQVRRVADARPGIFIPPFEDCRAPAPGDTASRPDGKVCTQVAISANVEPGKYYAAYASCDVVRRQRPYWPAPPTKQPRADDPRLANPAYVTELAWVTEQVASSGCICCHDSRVVEASQWDINLGPTWLDTLSDPGLALFAGLADSSVLGVYPATQNHGFDRDKTGIASTDSARMKAFLVAELTHRGLTEEWARSVPPFGGPIYANSVKPPAVCQAGQGVDPEGKAHWTGGDARYVYVLAQGSKNPGVPPNLDLPAGTIWRLDVLASEAPVESGVPFGTTPPGTFQWFPESTPAQPLQAGTTYQLVALLDVGVPLVNCLFEFGSAVPPVVTPPAAVDAGSVQVDGGTGYSDAGGGADAGAPACTLAGGDSKGFGASCNDDSNCSCTANYCAKQPGQQPYCSAEDCKLDPSVCPAGWTCFDLAFLGLTSVCTKP